MSAYFENYNSRRRQALHDLLDVAYAELDGAGIRLRLSERHGYEGNWIVAESEHGTWQIAVTTDAQRKWKKSERPRVAFEQVEGWEPTLP